MRELTLRVQHWPFLKPLHITGYTLTGCDLLHVSIQEGEHCGQGEGVGIYYLDESPQTMLAQANSIRAEIEAGDDSEQLQALLPRGGARNAVDCALWDLKAKQAGKSIWQLLELEPHRIITGNTVGIDSPKEMAARARSLDSPTIKVKLNGDQPLERVRAVREARPDATIMVDVNQGWSFEQLVALAPRFQQLGVAMIEQPLPRGCDAALENYDSPITLCADESCLDRSELAQAARRYQMINIKLDKTGGLTEALALASEAQSMGLRLMVGNMAGTSLSLAPAYVIAQCCELVDLDATIFLQRDREPAMKFDGGLVSGLTPALWG